MAEVLKIPFRLAEPGMVLGSAVMRGGAVIVAAGTELTPTLLTRLSTMGIEELEVERGDAGEGLAEQLDASLERLDALFEHYGSDPWMLEIKEVLRDHFRLRSAPDGKGAPTKEQS